MVFVTFSPLIDTCGIRPLAQTHSVYTVCVTQVTDVYEW